MIKSYTYKKNNKKYYEIQLSYSSKGGKRFQKKTKRDFDRNRITTYSMASRLEKEYYSILKAEAEDLISNISFKEWQKEFLEKIKPTHKKGTIMQYDGDLKKWLPPKFLELDLREIRPSHIYSLIHEHLPQEGANAHTQKRISKNLRVVFGRALDEGLITINPANGVKIKVPPTKKLVLNTKEAQTLLEEAKRYNHVFYHVWAFALFSGMRSGELIGLRWTDVDEVAGNITVSMQWTNKDGYHTTKSNKNRIVPISPQLKRLLTELRSLGPYSANFNVTGKDRLHVTDLVLPRIKDWRDGQQAAVLRSFLRLIKVKEVKFHDLRATFITNLLNANVPLVQVMAVVGHSKLSTTDEYLRIAGVSTRGSLDQISYKLPEEVGENVIQMQGKRGSM